MNQLVNKEQKYIIDNLFFMQIGSGNPIAEQFSYLNLLMKLQPNDISMVMTGFQKQKAPSFCDFDGQKWLN